MLHKSKARKLAAICNCSKKSVAGKIFCDRILVVIKMLSCSRLFLVDALRFHFLIAQGHILGHVKHQ